MRVDPRQTEIGDLPEAVDALLTGRARPPDLSRKSQRGRIPIDLLAALSDDTDGSFILLDGTATTVPLMHSGIRTGYVSTGLFEAVRLPYAGDAAMVIGAPQPPISLLR